MKCRHQFLRRILLLAWLPILVATHTSAQPAKDPTQDLSVTFSSERQGDGPGVVFGAVRNNSTHAYPCVRVEFDLFTRFDQRQPGEDAKHLGVLPVEVRDVQPRAEQSYRQALPLPAGVALKSVSECEGQSGEPKPPPPPPPPPPSSSPTPAATGDVHHHGDSVGKTAVGHEGRSRPAGVVHAHADGHEKHERS